MRKGILLLMLLSASASAEELNLTPSTTPIPDELQYQENPIDPLCFVEMDQHTHISDLTKCGVEAEKNREISNYNSNFLKKGFVGYDYAWSTDTNLPAATGYGYYRYLGKADDYDIVYVVSSGGGSGQFSAIDLVKRTGDKILVEPINDGDRCNNGITQVKNENNSLVYTVNMTPYDFIRLTKINPHQLKPSDLETCASCCAATVVFTRDLKNIMSEKMNYVDLDSYSRENTPSDQPYQACFNKLVTTYKKNGQTHLNNDQLQGFMKEFNEKCIV